MVFNRYFFPIMNDFSMSGTLQAVTYTIKVVVSKKCCKIDTLLLHTTNRKFHMANPVVGWWRGTVVERRSLAGELSLSCARPAADG